MGHGDFSRQRSRHSDSRFAAGFMGGFVPGANGLRDISRHVMGILGVDAVFDCFHVRSERVIPEHVVQPPGEVVPPKIALDPAPRKGGQQSNEFFERAGARA